MGLVPSRAEDRVRCVQTAASRPPELAPLRMRRNLLAELVHEPLLLADRFLLTPDVVLLTKDLLLLSLDLLQLPQLLLLSPA